MNGPLTYPYESRPIDVLQTELLTPVILASFQNQQTGEWVMFDMEFDTGASVTMLPASAAEMLGITLRQGYKVVMTGVGGGNFDAYIHPMTIKLNGSLIEIYVAFATFECPALLGRFTVFEQLNMITLANAQQQTQILGITPIALPDLPTDNGPPPFSMTGILAAVGLISPFIFILAIRRAKPRA